MIGVSWLQILCLIYFLAACVVGWRLLEIVAERQRDIRDAVGPRWFGYVCLAGILAASVVFWPLLLSYVIVEAILDARKGDPE
jgi:TRAP-type C4-dicarboxylate transport system permease small subunit